MFIDSIESTFDLNVCGKYMLKDVECNMVYSGINVQIDELSKQNEELYLKLTLLKEHFLSFSSTKDGNYISIQRLDKEVFSCL